MKEDQITILIPVFNGGTTLRDVFDSLEKQNNKKIIKEIIIINDGSSDASHDIILDYKKKSSYSIMIIKNEKSTGLAINYNRGIQISKTDYIILMHQDIVLEDMDSFAKIFQPFQNSNVAAAYPALLHPYKVWTAYNFWQKCLFSRFVSKRHTRFTGKFDCVKKIKDLKFNSSLYRTAGEDLDYEMRCSKYGKVVLADLDVVHLHNKDNNFSLKQLIKKESQLAECYGVNLRRYFLKTKIKDIILLIFRPMILLGLFINIFFINRLALLILLLFCFYYTKLAYLKCYKDFKIIILPFINFICLICYSFYFIKGFIYAKQKI
ncbi:glycosyltransferase family 2 protein [Candidatus Parcubacteria bacterium]|nr:glycosyltransferase family 2 protein [Candidatus Parcubacteria bacterium]